MQCFRVYRINYGYVHDKTLISYRNTSVKIIKYEVNIFIILDKQHLNRVESSDSFSFLVFFCSMFKPNFLLLILFNILWEQ